MLPKFGKGIPFTEDSPLGGEDPYSASKACAEIATNSFIHSFFGDSSIDGSTPRVATARAGNIIGGGDWGEDRLIPDLARALRTGEKLISDTLTLFDLGSSFLMR